jgi:hypothetical protein
MLSRVDQTGLLLPRWRILVEIALIFAVFFIQGAWPVPDVNEPYYLGKTIHYWNPAWAAGDFFLDSKDTHQVFYLTFGWLSLWLTPTAMAWTGRLVTWWLLAWSWRRLSFAVLPRPGWSILSAALFAMLMDRFHMAGEWVIGGVEAKGFAYVLVFLGLEALVKNHWNRVWLLLGASSALHVLVGGWAALAAMLAWLLTRISHPTDTLHDSVPLLHRSSACSNYRPLLALCQAVAHVGEKCELIGHDWPRLRSMWPSLLGGLLLALPGLLPAVLLNANTDATTIRQADNIYVFERLPHHLDIFQIDPHFIIRFLLLTLLYFVLNWRMSLITYRGATGDIGAKTVIKRLRAFVIGALAIALAGAAINILVFFNRDLAALLLRYYWFRLADVAVPLGVSMLGCWWIVDSWPSRQVIGRFAAVLVGLATLYHFGALAVQRLQPAIPRADRLANPLAWQEACLWASDARNTPPTARFITPRQSQTFKWYASRAEAATWKDVPQAAIEIVEWRARIQELFMTDGSNPEYRWYESLNELGLKRLEQLGKKYKADFLITESVNPPLNLKVVYQNEYYIIYKLRKD